jgi:predicted alpha/beta-fold hydrolase
MALRKKDNPTIFEKKSPTKQKTCEQKKFEVEMTLLEIQEGGGIGWVEGLRHAWSWLSSCYLKLPLGGLVSEPLPLAEPSKLRY